MNQNIENSRQLVCIMFTDVVGYTEAMGLDEERALGILKQNREIQKPLVNKHGGVFIKELGDGVLATFSSVTNAVQAAAEILLQVKEKTSFNLRIGIHLSEVLFENGDVFGDGVNIASRIQSKAAVGSILVSESVQKNLTNKKGLVLNYVDAVELKNVKQPVSIYEVTITPDFEIKPITAIEQPKTIVIKKEKSIAVLPFLNLSNDSEQEYFSDGVAEDIIITLSSIQDLKVVGRRSSFAFKGQNISTQQLGQALGAATILEGSVRKMGNKLRVNTELINAADGKQLWAQKYDREIVDIFEIQDDIANSIAQNLKLNFFADNTKVNNTNLEAYELLLEGRFQVERYVEGFEKALVCFSKAIEIDPNYAEAYAELSKLHLLLTMNLFHAPSFGFETARHFAEKALALNNELGAAHYVLGQINFWYNWDFAQSKLHYEQAEQSKQGFYFSGVVIDPWYYAFVHGDFNAAVKAIEKILETDPLSLHANLHLGYFYTYGLQFDKAIAVLNKILSFVPTFSEAERMLAFNYLFKGELATGLQHAEKAAKLSHDMGWAQNTYIIALALNGQKEKAEMLTKEYEITKGPVHTSPIGIGLIYSSLGQLDKAFDYFQKGIDKKDIWAVALKYSPDFMLLRNDPRFEALVKQIPYI
jgi:adenylate cyclase